MKKKRIMILVSVIILFMIGVVSLVLFLKKDKKTVSDMEKFSAEYHEVAKNNVFVYRNIDEIINILEKGTGIVYLGFPECKWCQRYTKYLNEVAMDMGISKIYYYNIREDRKLNTENYHKIVSILENYLQNDEEGNKRIYVPSVIALKKGEIVGFDDETAWDTKGFETPDEYWNTDEVNDLKEKLEKMIADTGSNICTECN
jgi:rhodanese domain protein